MQTKGLYPVPRIETTRLLNILKGIATIPMGTIVCSSLLPRTLLFGLR